LPCRPRDSAFADRQADLFEQRVDLGLVVEADRLHASGDQLLHRRRPGREAIDRRTAGQRSDLGRQAILVAVHGLGRKFCDFNELRSIAVDRVDRETVGGTKVLIDPMAVIAGKGDPEHARRFPSADQMSVSRRPAGRIWLVLDPVDRSMDGGVMVVSQEEVGDVEQGLARAAIADPGPRIAADPVVLRETCAQQG
jgi:hypothetical protein